MRRVSLSVEGMGTCCSATSLGSSGGGADWVPDIANIYERIYASEGIWWGMVEV